MLSRDPRRIAVIGTGRVGSTLAYTLVLAGAAPEVVLIDADSARSEGEAMDLNHAVPFVSPARVWSGTIDDCAGAAIVVVAAGSGQKPGETRLDLARRNAGTIADVAARAAERNPTGIFLVATNPVDVLSYVTWKASGFPASRVIGSGTILDTARLRHLLGQHFHVDPRSVHAYVVGEHGDSEVPVWSRTTIAGMPLDAFCRAAGCRFDSATKEGIVQQTRDAAYEIIERKSATQYGIAAGLLRVIEAILRDQRTVLTVSTLVSDYDGIDDVYLSLPAIVGSGGVEQVLRLELEPDERAALRRSADVLKRATADVASAPAMVRRQDG